MFTKFATFEDASVISVKGSATRQHTASLDTLSDFDNYRTDDGYMYVALRAISSRINKNHDGWPTIELAGGPEVFENHAKQASSGFTVEAADGNKEYGFATFLGKPNFVDHNNSDPKRARGVVVDSKFRVLPLEKVAASGDDYWTKPGIDPQHLPPSEIELLLEIDAKQFPKYAKSILNGELDGFSMGCDCEESECSHCGHIATNPSEFCSHILTKGAHHDFKTADGKRISRRSYENCRKIKFFEISGVFEPADETALKRGIRASVNNEGMQKIAENPLPQSMHTTAPEDVDTLRQEKICPVCGESMEGEECDHCFLAGTLVRTKSGYTPIEKIVPGDEVLGETGKFNPVIEVMTRTYHGKIKKIDGPSLVEPIYVTGNHPFKTLIGNHESKKQRCQPGRCERHTQFKQIHSIDWVHAECLSFDSYIATGIPLIEESIEFIDIPQRYTEKRKHGQLRKGPRQIELTDEVLWAIGLYIAEGSTGSRSISYASHKDETEYQDRIKTLFSHLGYHTRTEYDDQSNRACVVISSSALAEWFPEWLGKGSDNKHIPSELMSLPLDRLQHVYQGILDGDGCDRGNDIKQTSKILALQINEIARRLGISATIQRAHESGKKESFTVNNVLDKKRDYYTPITDKTTKAPRNTWDIHGHKLYRLKSVEDIPYSGSVYNLRVANDPTYVVQNLIVHNCGYVEPPKGLDNPDLNKAQEIQEQMRQKDEALIQQPQGSPEDVGNQGAPQGPNEPGNQSGSFLQTRNQRSTASIIGEMRWAPVMDSKLAGRINQIEQPLNPVAKPATNEPVKTTVIKSPTGPRTAQQIIGDTMSTKTADGPTPPGDTSADTRTETTGVGGVLDASNEQASKADAQIDVTGIGTTGVTDVNADKTETLPSAGENSDDAGFNKDKTTEDSGPTSTYGDSDGTEKGFTDAVTNESLEGNKNKESGVHMAYDPKPFVDEPGLSGGSANKGTQPSDPVGKAQDRVNVLEAVTTPDNNSGPTSTWSGTDGNAIYRQQEPVTKEAFPQDATQYKGETWTSHIVAAMKLADTEVDLDLLPKDEKYNRIAELEGQSDDQIAAQLNTLSRVKTAGLAKLAKARTAGVTRMPANFGRRTAAPNPDWRPSGQAFERVTDGEHIAHQEPIGDDVLDSSLFA